ncbi:uncharacterized protein LOC125039197 isoform X1 [Penaeus chinensis]|uniref:uncharacterized protein LOC125039197 isoform X1 n=1 Tax=Penaeus chinensis TaxID=139456 RepID=UPI001FB5D177|nr:uncharacterized protein LOC125039197 isoform X1 [Penaeus chinensis]
MLKGLSSHTWLPACSKFLQGVSSRGKSPLSSRNLNGAPPRDNAAAPPNRQTGGVVFGIACAGYATFLLSVTGRLIYNNRRRREEKRRLATLEPAAKGGGDVHVFWVLAPGRKVGTSLLCVECPGNEVKVFDLVVGGYQERSWRKGKKRQTERKRSYENVAIVEEASGSEIPRRRRSSAPSPAARGVAPGPPAGSSASGERRSSLSSEEEGRRPGFSGTADLPPEGMPVPEGGVAGQESLKEEAPPGKSKS